MFSAFLYLAFTSFAINAQAVNSYVDSGPNSAMQALLAKADRQALVPIILRSRSLSDRKSSAEQIRAKLLSNQSYDVFRAKADSGRTIRTFKYSALTATAVNRDELVALIDDPDIEVFENSIKRPLLSSSVPLVYPSLNISPFHGNNEWAVAVVDTGVDKSHLFFKQKIVSEACFSNIDELPAISSLCPGGVTTSTASGSGVNCNLLGCDHGTQVAGIAAGNGSAFNGVARDAKLISIQVFSQVTDESQCGFGVASCLGGAITSDIIAGLEHVYELRNSFKIASVNLSLGSAELFSGSCDEQPEREIIDMLTEAGIAVVVSTGNSGNNSQIQSPACITNAVAVAASSATSQSESAWINNNISNQLDLFAPGIDITTSTTSQGFVSATGTSHAAPHVAGAWVAMKHASPSLTVANGEQLLKSFGPTITQHSVTRRRLSLSAVLNSLVPGSQVISNPTQPSPPLPPLNREGLSMAGVVLLLLDED